MPMPQMDVLRSTCQEISLIGWHRGGGSRLLLLRSNVVLGHVLPGGLRADALLVDQYFVDISAVLALVLLVLLINLDHLHFVLLERFDKEIEFLFSDEARLDQLLDFFFGPALEHHAVQNEEGLFDLFEGLIQVAEGLSVQINNVQVVQFLHVLPDFADRKLHSQSSLFAHESQAVVLELLLICRAGLIHKPFSG